MSSKGADGCSIESPGNLSVFVGGVDVHSSLNMALVNVFYNPLFYLVYLRGISLFHLLVGLLSYCMACNAPVLEAQRMLLQ